MSVCVRPCEDRKIQLRQTKHLTESFVQLIGKQYSFLSEY